MKTGAKRGFFPSFQEVGKPTLGRQPEPGAPALSVLVTHAVVVSAVAALGSLVGAGGAAVVLPGAGGVVVGLGGISTWKDKDARSAPLPSTQPQPHAIASALEVGSILGMPLPALWRWEASRECH